MNQTNEWAIAQQVWDEFVSTHPELGYKPGFWPLHNFLRHFREPLMNADAIRKAKARHWLANRAAFDSAAFNCATGKCVLPGAQA